MNLLVYYSHHQVLFTTTLGQLKGGQKLPFTAACHQGAIELTKAIRVSFAKNTSQRFVSAIVLCLLLLVKF